MSKRKNHFDEEQEVAVDKKPCLASAASLTNTDYTIGWICALPKEQTAATAKFDCIHKELPKRPDDHNTYTLGSIGPHNIVLACLPKGQYGTNSAAIAATQLVASFPSVKVGLMVGIGGGLPSKVRLGDVVVSVPVDQYPGVVQWDMGKAGDVRRFKRRSRMLPMECKFLLAQLHFDSVRTKRTSKKIKDALKRLPVGSDSGAIGHAYDDAMQRIAESDAESRKLAKDVLSWITCAQRPLSTSEIRHALAVEPSFRFDEENLLDLHDIVSVCAGMITVDEKSDIIRLAHYTTEEYFRGAWARWLPDAHRNIATTCVIYLLFDVFKSGPCSTDAEFEARLNLYPLHSYAAQNWGYHAHKHPIPDIFITALLEDNSKLGASVQGLFGSKAFTSHTDYSQQIPTLVKELHLAAFFELEAAVRLLIGRRHQSDAKDSFNRTPITWAATIGSLGVVQLLVHGNIDLNSVDDEGRTPLAWAACNGHESIISSLLSRQDLDIESKDRYGRTPLSLAASCGCVRAIEALVRRGADPDSKDYDGRTPLSWAACRNRVEVMKSLLLWGVDPDSRDLDGQTPLSWAAHEGCDDAVAVLLMELMLIQTPGTK